MPADQLMLHVCIRGEAGITVLDSCPSRTACGGFSSSLAFSDAVAESGPPQAQIEPKGEVVNMLGSSIHE
jgi:hypothetical protein